MKSKLTKLHCTSFGHQVVYKQYGQNFSDEELRAMEKALEKLHNSNMKFKTSVGEVRL